MPYIDPVRRQMLNHPVEALAWHIETAGELNYAIFRLALERLRDRGGNYAALNEVDGVLGLCQAEFRRRVVFPYEDRKIAAHGDVLPAPTPAATAQVASPQASRLQPAVRKMRHSW